MSKVDEINAYLDAFLPTEVEEALLQREERSKTERLATEWKSWLEEGTPPRSYEWRKVNGQTQYREPSMKEAKKGERKEHTPIKTRETLTSITCPTCGDKMFKEGVCPTCEDGKKGFRIRLLCGECEHVELL